MKLKSILALVVLATLSFSSVACRHGGRVSVDGLHRIVYDFDSAAIRPDMAKILSANAQYLQKHSNMKVVVEGYCDERGTNEYNLALGDRRAQAASQYLVTRGVSQGRLKTTSYGEERPLNKGHNEAAWQENRRAEFARQ